MIGRGFIQEAIELVEGLIKTSQNQSEKSYQPYLYSIIMNLLELTSSYYCWGHLGLRSALDIIMYLEKIQSQAHRCITEHSKTVKHRAGFRAFFPEGTRAILLWSILSSIQAPIYLMLNGEVGIVNTIKTSNLRAVLTTGQSIIIKAPD